MTKGKKYWLMKSEPTVFSINDLMKSLDRTTCWEGVRNYQARNFMRDEMKVGDLILFYHSGKNPSAVGIARVVKEGYPDDTAWDDQSDYFDPKSTPENPIWYRVDIQFEKKFSRSLSLKELRKINGLEDMMLLKKGMRLSVQPVTKEEFDIIVSL
jgi:predicted RNA-binding protein with PUA-like domain